MILGAFLALAWANANFDSYHSLVDYDIGTFGGFHFSPHSIINEILMCIFFALAGKEILEAFLPGGALNRPENRALPFIATAGGMLVPAGLFAVMALIIERDLLPGLAIPMATDIAFAALFGKVIFGSLKHPVVQFLLVLAIADDAGGLIVLAVFYQDGDIAGLFTGGVLLAIALGLTLVLRKQFGVTSYLGYAVPGVISWIALHVAGLAPAISLVPVVLLMPHAKRDLGIFTEAHRNGQLKDTLNKFEHHMELPVEFILCVFAFVNAGVVISTMGNGTLFVLIGLLVGKPLGIFSFAVTAMKLRGYTLPDGMEKSDLLVMGMIAGIGFTVSLFVAGVAFVEGPLLDATRLGALASFGSAAVAIIYARVRGVGRFSRSKPFYTVPSAE